MKNITVKKLKNGIKLIHERREGSTIAAVSIRLKAGSMYGEKPGIAHLLEHIVLSGTKNYPTKNELENLVSESGGRGGGSTSYEDVQYWSLAPDRAFDSALKYVFEATFQPLLQEGDFVREQKIVFQESKKSDSQSFELARRKIFLRLFAETPFAQTILGSPEEIMNLQLSDVVNFWKENYHPQSAVLSVVIDRDFESVVKHVEKIFSFSEMKKEATSSVSIQFKNLTSADLSFVDDSQADQSQIVISYRAPTFFDETKPAGDILAAILGSGKTSRLFKAVRQEKGLTYSVSAFLRSNTNYSRFGIVSGTTSELLPELFDIVCREVQRMCIEECTDAELESAKERSIFNYYVQHEKSQDRADTLSWLTLYSESPEKWLDIESRYAKVTKKDIQDAAKTIFASFPAVAVVKRPTDTISLDPDKLVYKE